MNMLVEISLRQPVFMLFSVFYVCVEATNTTSIHITAERLLHVVLGVCVCAYADKKESMCSLFPSTRCICWIFIENVYSVSGRYISVGITCVISIGWHLVALA